MSDYQKIKNLQIKIQGNRDKLKIEKDYKKREILNIKIKIDELKIKLERIK